MIIMETTLRDYAVVPVVQIDDATDAVRLGKALSAGNLPVAEITFRTDAAAQSIANIRESCPDIVVGAGTVLTPETVDRAVASGASFVVTPGLNPAVVERCLEHGIPIVPGVNSPSQVEQALSLGLTLLKFFPAEPSGGISMVRALGGPYRNVGFMPTGGVTIANASAWLAEPNVVAVGGTWIATSADISAGRFDLISENARTASQLLRPAANTP